METKENTICLESHRIDSVRQHEAAALREMTQMVMAAENGGTTDGLERAVTQLEQFLQQVRRNCLMDEKQRALEKFQQEFEHGYTWNSGFFRNVQRFGSRTALTDLESGRSWNYAQLNAEATGLLTGCSAPDSARVT